MAETLRELLIQRAARLQDRPALTAAPWGTLTYAQFRNRVEGLAMGLLAGSRAPGSPVFLAEASPWAWAAEVAAACAGLCWEPAGEPVPPTCLGGPGFNSEDGRGPYHDREAVVVPGLAFHGGLTQGELMRRLSRWNARLGWDHETVLALPQDAASTAAGRAALWSALYAGAHAVLGGPAPSPPRWFARRRPVIPAFDPASFQGFWEA